jgi:hypothetical protein
MEIMLLGVSFFTGAIYLQFPSNGMHSELGWLEGMDTGGSAAVRTRGIFRPFL